MAERNSGGSKRVTPGYEQTIAAAVYPVGAVFMSMNPTPPEEVLGYGVWVPVDHNFYLTSK